ncbi:DUF362 domain-containing protein [Maridesulfovibrio sp.]|uniref:DUF362 domain-containing protein n=1 Tax=Maridesulfovibrio sp. TaxID=2795000 RepID=UPI002A188685|nr:DUF362 domain-containing protein [Maridesulfovibrio sp.]
MSKVYFWNLRTSSKSPHALRMKKLLKQSGLNAIVDPGNLVALKIHFGESGNTGYLNALILRPIVEFLKKAGAKPFFTDTSTLYVGDRGESVSHGLLAARHGYDPNVIGAPVLFADGLRGEYQVTVPYKGNYISEAYVGGMFMEADMLVTLNHVKGHGLAGYGGAIKNVGMGCASKKGKMHVHASTGPKFAPENCVGCGVCVSECAAGALDLDDDGIVKMSGKCTGCGRCFLSCRYKAIVIDWKRDVGEFTNRLIEYNKAILDKLKRPAMHINFLQNITPDCDCHGYSDAPICPDLGVMISSDPVAVDQASLDMINAAPPLYPSRLPEGLSQGDDKFKALAPEAPDGFGLKYAEKIGLGSRNYKLITI